MKLGICVNHYHPLIGGCEKVTQKIAEYFVDRGHEVFVFTRRVRNRNANVYKNYEVIEYFPGRWEEFHNQVKKIELDLMFIYSDVFDFYRYIVCQPNKFRTILATCGANWTFKNASFANILYRNIKHLDRIVLHSEHDRDYKLINNDRMKEKTVIIPNGIDVEEFDNNNLERKDILPEHESKKWVLNVANFFPGKGQEHMIHVLNKLPDPENIVYIQASSDIDFPIGEKLELLWKKRISQHLNKKISVEFVKNAEREKIVGLFKQSNVFAFTSEKEVAPIVLLESMAASLPWVCCDVGNSRGLQGGKWVAAIKDSRYHCRFDDRVYKLFSRYVEDVWSSHSTGEQGRRQIDQDLTWDKVLPQYSSIIEV